MYDVYSVPSILNHFLWTKYHYIFLYWLEYPPSFHNSAQLPLDRPKKIINWSHICSNRSITGWNGHTIALSPVDQGQVGKYKIWKAPTEKHGGILEFPLIPYPIHVVRFIGPANRRHWHDFSCHMFLMNFSRKFFDYSYFIF